MSRVTYYSLPSTLLHLPLEHTDSERSAAPEQWEGHNGRKLKSHYGGGSSGAYRWL